MSWLRFITEPPATPKGVEKEKKEKKVGVRYDTEWAHKPLAKSIRKAAVFGFFKPATRYWGRPRVVGLDRLKDIEGPVILAANHHSHADTSVLLATLPSHLRDNLSIAAGADYFFPNRLSSALSALFIGAFPIERTKLSKLSIHNGLRALQQGRNLLIFPEGGRSPDGWRQEHRPGAAFLAKRGGTPVIPVYLDGTASILPKGKNWPTRSRCAVVFGSPLHIAEGEDARTFAKRIESRVGELADEFNSGWWQARKNAYRRQTPDGQGPDAGAWRRRWALGKEDLERSEKASGQTWPKL